MTLNQKVVGSNPIGSANTIVNIKRRMVKAIRVLMIIEYPNRIGDFLMCEAYWPLQMTKADKISVVTDITELQSIYFPDAPPDPDCAYEKLLAAINNSRRR